MTRTSLGRLAVIASLLFTPLAAQAQQKDDAATAEARARFNEGIKLADQSDHEAARLKFGQAWTLLKSPAILFNLARSEQLSNHLVESLEHFRLYRTLNDPKVTEEQRKRANDYIAQLVTQVCHIDVEAPAGARITIDGKPVEWTPGADPIAVLPGKHAVEATPADGKAKSETVDCGAGTTGKAKLVEMAAPTAAPAPMPVVSAPPAEPPPSFWTTGRVIGASMAGAGLLAVGAGVFFHLQASSAGDEADALRGRFGVSGCAPAAGKVLDPSCATLAQKNEDENSAQTLRSAFLIGGGALIAGGAVLFLVSAPASKTGSLRVLPYASARDGGLQISGRF